MAWPTTVLTSALDADTDTLDEARVQVLATTEGLNDIIASRDAASGIPSLDAGSVVTESQLRQLRTPVIKTANHTTVASDNARIMICEGAITITIDDTIAEVGTYYTIKNGNLSSSDSSVTIAVSGGSAIEGETPVTLRPGDVITVVRGSGSWYSLNPFRGDSISGTDYSAHRFTYYNRLIMEPGSQWVTITTDVPVRTWESVGATGSGADNIWIGLDDVPELTGYIIVQAYCTANHTGSGGLVSTDFYARPYDSTDNATWENLIVSAGGYGTSTVDVSTSSTRVIPIDSNRRFEVYWDEFTNNDVTNIYMSLIGFMN